MAEKFKCCRNCKHNFESVRAADDIYLICDIDCEAIDENDVACAWWEDKDGE